MCRVESIRDYSPGLTRLRVCLSSLQVPTSLLEEIYTSESVPNGKLEMRAKKSDRSVWLLGTLIAG